MTNREYINQMSDKELAQCMVDMGKLCEQCYHLGDTYCDEGRVKRSGLVNLIMEKQTFISL